MAELFEQIAKKKPPPKKQQHIKLHLKLSHDFDRRNTHYYNSNSSLAGSKDKQPESRRAIRKQYPLQLLLVMSDSAQLKQTQAHGITGVCGYSCTNGP